MAKIKTSHLHRRNRVVDYTFTKVSFDKDGIAEIKESYLKDILVKDKSITLLETIDTTLPSEELSNENAAPVTEVISPSIVTEGPITFTEPSSTLKEVVEEEKLNKEEYKSYLESITKNQLIQIVTDADFPKEEWGKLNKGPLIDYILEKM